MVAVYFQWRHGFAVLKKNLYSLVISGTALPDLLTRFITEEICASLLKLTTLARALTLFAPV